MGVKSKLFVPTESRESSMEPQAVRRRGMIEAGRIRRRNFDEIMPLLTNNLNDPSFHSPLSLVVLCH